MSETEKPKRKRARRRPLAKLYADLEIRVAMARQILRGADRNSTADTGVRIGIALDVLDGTEPMDGKESES